MGTRGHRASSPGAGLTIPLRAGKQRPLRGRAPRQSRITAKQRKGHRVARRRSRRLRRLLEWRVLPEADNHAASSAVGGAHDALALCGDSNDNATRRRRPTAE